MSKEEQVSFANNLKDNYDCRIINKESEPYCLFCASDIGKIIGIKNIKNNIIKNCEKFIIKTDTPGGKQDMLYITYDDVLRIVSNSRKQKVIDFCKNMNIEMYKKVFICIEVDTLKCIVDSFEGEKMTCQYKIGKYFIDLYFPDYKLIIECDEKGHLATLNKMNDIIRENEIKSIVDNCVFIRYDPYLPDFNIFKIINKIHTHIQ